ncbi:MAG: hypothetical protein ACRYGK_01420 [Janthinobacterium lividum]
MHAPKHFHLCGLKSHCPDGFVVVFSETNTRAAHQLTLLRAELESDAGFWERVVKSANALLAERPGENGLIICKYHPPTLEEATLRDNLFNGSNLTWHAVNHGVLQLSA